MFIIASIVTRTYYINNTRFNYINSSLVKWNNPVHLSPIFPTEARGWLIPGAVEYKTRRWRLGANNNGLKLCCCCCCCGGSLNNVDDFPRKILRRWMMAATRVVRVRRLDLR
jgi:hypothetical protein